jgi:hypothetical protein
MPFTPPTTIASLATTGYLAQLLIGSPLTAVAELKSFKCNWASVPDVPTSTLLSPNNTEEMLPGMIKPGTIELSGNFTGIASQLAITPLMQAQTVFAFEIKASMQSAAKTYTGTGQGFVNKYEVGAFENNKPTEFSATIQMTGTYVEAVA